MTGARVTIVDYGAGNVRSVAKAIEKLGRTPHVTGNPDDVVSAEAIIFPGQGASESAMTTLNERGLVEPLRESIARGVPFFGVCLGLQLLLDTSEEGPSPCLGVAPGRVRLLPEQVKRPHMGWNRVDLLGDHPVFRGVAERLLLLLRPQLLRRPRRRVAGAGHYGVRPPVLQRAG